MTATQPTLFDLESAPRPRRPRAPSAPECDAAADGWAEADSIAERRRDSRRILMGMAFKLVAMGEARDCREGFRLVRRRYEARCFTLPANV